MSTKEKIKVFAIENNKSALNVLSNIFEDNDSYEFNSLKVSGNDSKQVEKSRSEDKQLIMDTLINEPFDILILDLLLRDTVDTDPEKVEGEEFKGIETLLSLEIARKLKEMTEKEDFLPVFISSSEICSSHSRFQAMKGKQGDQIPKDAVFIFKPSFKYKRIRYINCPVYSSSKKPVCEKTQRETGGCSQKTCFLELLNKYYKEYTEGKDNAK